MSARPSSKLSESLTAWFRRSSSDSSRSLRRVSGSVEKQLPLDPEGVEGVVHEVRAPLLHFRKARAPLLVESTDLAVENGVRRSHRLSDLPRETGEAGCEVVAVSARQLHLAARDRRDRPIAVPLDLVHPTGSLRHLVRKRGEHGRDLGGARRSLGRRLGRLLDGLVPLLDQKPVLGIAGELRRHQGPEPLQPLTFEADGQPAVALLLDELVHSRVPDLDRPSAIVSGRDLALEARVVEWVILDVNGEVPLAGLERNPLRDRPACERPVALEAKVVVESPSIVSLHHEDRCFPTFLPSERLGCLRFLSLALVFGEPGHAHSVPIRHRSMFRT